MIDRISTKKYRELLDQILAEIEVHRVKAAKEINATQMQLYYTIGGLIVKRQEAEGWGKSVVEKLAKDLTGKTTGYSGYSSSNLWFMRQFYTEYADEKQLYNLACGVSWGQNIIILTKLKDNRRRKYYLTKTIEAGWSRATLINQIKAHAYEKKAVNQKQHNFKKVLPENLSEQALEVLKSDYTLDFLGINEPMLERELESKLVGQIKEFILELGYGFSFIGNQHKLTLNGKDYFIDLLFFHRKLKSLIAVDLKIGEFKPEYAGKMNFYLNLLNDTARFEGENPAIGIILCAVKDNIEVEYALSGVKNPIGIAEYSYAKQLPAKLKKELPGVRELEEKLRTGLKTPKRQ